MIIDDADFDPFYDLDMLDLGVLPERPYGVRGHFPSADKVKNYHARLLFANVHGITGRDGERFIVFCGGDPRVYSCWQFNVDRCLVMIGLKTFDEIDDMSRDGKIQLVAESLRQQYLGKDFTDRDYEHVRAILATEEQFRFMYDYLCDCDPQFVSQSEIDWVFSPDDDGNEVRRRSYEKGVYPVMRSIEVTDEDGYFDSGLRIVRGGFKLSKEDVDGLVTRNGANMRRGDVEGKAEPRIMLSEDGTVYYVPGSVFQVLLPIAGDENLSVAFVGRDGD